MLQKRRPIGIKKSVIYFLAACLMAGIYFALEAQEFRYPYSYVNNRDPLRPLVNERGEIMIKEKKEVPAEGSAEPEEAKGKDKDKK